MQMIMQDIQWLQFKMWWKDLWFWCKREREREENKFTKYGMLEEKKKVAKE